MKKGGGGLANAEIREKCIKIARKYGFFSKSSRQFNNFCQIMYFLPKTKRLFRKRVALNMFTKMTQKGRGGSANADKTDWGRGGWGKG